MEYLYEKNDKVCVNIIVSFGSENLIVGIFNDRLKIKIRKKPINNAANKELIKFLSNILVVGKTNIKIINGTTNRNKTVEISSLKLKDIKEIFE